MSNETILMIASGMKQSKKDFLDSSVESIYLNYGLLGLGSILYDKGYTEVKMFQGDNKSIVDMFCEIESTNIDIKSLRYPVFVSIPSFFAVSWALEFIETLKLKKPGAKVILGGRWVLDQNLEWCRNKFKQVDFFSIGCPDEIVDKLLFCENWPQFQPLRNCSKPFSRFHFNILNQFKYYQPVIELCRGCGRGCEFCLERRYPVSQVKSAKDVIYEAKETCRVYGTDDLNFYFEASIFNPTLEWANEFLLFYRQENMKFQWRFETRVDTINLESLKILSQAGLKVIDLGLESASVVQLKKMGKSKHPTEYLSKADSLLRKMFEYGIWSKINILLYIGETDLTLKETMAWLDARNKYIKGVSVNPLIVYLNGNQTDDFVVHIENETCVGVEKELLYENGYLFISLSKEMSIKKSQKITNMLVGRYMSQEDYVQLKNVCYTRRNLSNNYS